MRLRLLSGSPALLPRLLRDRRGAIAIIVALSLPLIIGFLAIGVEAGLWYAEKAQGQSAADSGAISAANAIVQSDSTPGDWWTLAKYDAVNNHAWANAGAAGGAPTTPLPTGTPCPPPPDVMGAANNLCVNKLLDGSGNPLGAEVYLWQQQSTTLASVFAIFQGFSKSNVTVLSHAVAKVQNVNTNLNCLVATNAAPTGGYNGKGVDIAVGGTGGTGIFAPNCGIATYSLCPDSGACKNDESIEIKGGGFITAASLVSAGAASVTNNGSLIVLTPAVYDARVFPPLPPNPFYNNLDPYCSATPGSAPGTSWPPSGSIYHTDTGTDIGTDTGTPTCTPNVANWPTGSATLPELTPAPWHTSTLTFASLPTSVVVGETVTDLTNSVLQSGTRVSAVDPVAHTVTLDHQVQSAPGVLPLDQILFGPQPAITWNSGTLNLSPGYYEQLCITGGTVNFASGTYYFYSVPGDASCSAPGLKVNDVFFVSGGNINQGTGTVEFVIDSGNIDITGGSFALTSFTAILTKVNGSSVGEFNFAGSGVTGTIQAPTTGACDVSKAPCFSTPTSPGVVSTVADTVAGILIYQNPTFNGTKGNSIALNSGCPAVLQGFVLSGPFSVDNLSGHSSDSCTDCTAIMAGAFTYVGNVSLDTSGCDREGLPAGFRNNFGVVLTQ